MTIRDSLAQVQELVAGMTPGALTVYDANEGDGWPPRPLWCFKNDAYDSGDEPALQGSIHYGGKEDADAIVAAVNFLREHGPALLRDAGDGWLPIESAPTEVHELSKCGEPLLLGGPGWVETGFYHDGSDCYGHRGEAGWFALEDWGKDKLLCASNIHPTHWRPLPQPPAMHAPGVAGGGEEGSLRFIAKRNLRKMIEIGSTDTKTMLLCLEELS